MKDGDRLDFWPNFDEEFFFGFGVGFFLALLDPPEKAKTQQKQRIEVQNFS